MAYIRQPIVSVLGHVDHGKSSLLDQIRGTSVVAREAGGITQHIGATEVPIEAIRSICGDLMAGKSFKIPGLLFIDTPGHVAFTTLRARGGALADLAVLVVDLNEGFRPQTVESINILRRYKTPFLVAANKIDMVPGWRKEMNVPFGVAHGNQHESVREELDKRLYELVGSLFQNGFSAERYDRIEDFATTVAVVPTSAKHGVGIPELLLVLIGLAQRFLEADLKVPEGPAEGTILEVKEEKGLGLTIDAIVYRGALSLGDTLVLGSAGKPIVTKVKALLKPKPLNEIRDPQDRFDSVDKVTAAAGVKIAASGLEGALAGAPLREVKGNLKAVVEAVAAETLPKIETSETGILVKADALGSLEAIAYECKQAETPIKIARVGPVSRRDVVDAATIPDPLHKVILAFNVRVLDDAREELLKNKDLKVIEGDVIYRLLEEYKARVEQRKTEIEAAKRLERPYPAKILFLPEYVFRASKPAIFGIRVLAGRIRPGMPLMRDDGKRIGRVRSVRSGEEVVTEAIAGKEVAIAVDGITVGRQVKGGDVLLVELSEEDARTLRDAELNPDEREVLEQIATIKRRTDPFWGM
ncbi:MAG TPA: translation initiation factor IF-2 [Thermoplasmata archaeon]|nr:translation initiation factor IF-2 [Thermoplasmata archaeon]